MQDKRYLLDLNQLFSGDSAEVLFQEALVKVDAERRQKALRMKKVKMQTASLGAGLLLQKALTDITEGSDNIKDKPKIQLFSVKELLARIECPIMEPEYGYGRNGKPYFKNYSLKFNLSHSGEYVFCGVSDQEIGADIQEIRDAKELSLARRFFSEGESMALEHCENDEERSQLFFRLWTRKEAYGKLTGQGIAGVLNKDLWAAGSEKEELIWEEYSTPVGYRIAVCKYAPAEWRLA